MAKDKKKVSLEKAEASAPEDTKSTKKAKKAETKSQKDDKKKGNSIGKWFHDLKVEFRNVTWPSRNTVVVNTSVVLTVIVAGSVVVGLLDSGLLKLLQFLIGLSQ